jgi:hypothetical protein
MHVERNEMFPDDHERRRDGHQQRHVENKTKNNGKRKGGHDVNENQVVDVLKEEDDEEEEEDVLPEYTKKVYRR